MRGCIFYPQNLRYKKMILDTVERASQYNLIGPGFAEAMKFLYENRNGGLTQDRYEISNDAYALVKRYASKPAENCKYEAHRDYIDVQYVVSGDEYMGWAPKDTMTIDTYIEEKDQFRLSGKGEMVPLHAGQFMILFPSDAHMPCVVYNQSAPVEKIILKIRVEAAK
jgi:biofilm protein TabA